MMIVSRVVWITFYLGIVSITRHQGFSVDILVVIAVLACAHLSRIALHK